MDQD
jgi:hypothetical protein